MKERVHDGRKLRHATARGAAFLIVQSFGARVVLFGVQLLLGWLLTPDDFGRSALAATMSNIAWSFVGFGVDDVLQQRSRSIHYWERSASLIVIVQGAIGATLILLSAPFVEHVLGVPDATGMMALAAGSLFIASWSVVPAAKIAASLDFKWLAGFNTFDLILAQTLIVAFAIAGFGPYSFFLPGPLCMALRVLLFWRRRPVDLSGRFRRSQILVVMLRGATAFGSRLAYAAMQQFDYIILGIAAAANIVGVYTFAFRLAAVPVRVIATNLQAVLFPALARLRGQADRQDRASLDAAEMLASIVAPLCLLQAAISGPALTLLFGEKWNDAVPLIWLLSLGLPAEAVYSVARARLSAAGQFGKALVYSLCQLVLFVSITTVGALLGREIGVAIAVSGFYMFVMPHFFFRVVVVDRSVVASASWRIFARPLLLSIGSALAGVGAAALVGAGSDRWLEMAIAAGVCVATYALATRVLCARLWTRMATAFSTLRQSRGALGEGGTAA